jgi:hypothetical protein
MRDNGKGDKRRPLVIPEEQFNANWDAIFKNSNKNDPILKIADSIHNAINDGLEKANERLDK